MYVLSGLIALQSHSQSIDFSYFISAVRTYLQLLRKLNAAITFLTSIYLLFREGACNISNIILIIMNACTLLQSIDFSHFISAFLKYL